MRSLRERAVVLNLPAAQVDAFFGAQIEAAKQLQRELFDRWREHKQGKFVNVAELDTMLRPQIDRITGQMLAELARWTSQPRPPMPPGELTMTALSPRSVQIALAPLNQDAGTSLNPDRSVH